MVGEAHVSMIPTTPKKVWSANVDGHAVQALAPSNAILLDVLRDEVGMLGVKRGCDLGTCCCCAVLVNGEPRLSSLCLAGQVEGDDITTVEGLADGAHLAPIQTCFATHGVLNVVSAHQASLWLLRLCSIQIQSLLVRKYLVRLKEIFADVLVINKLSIQLRLLPK